MNRALLKTTRRTAREKRPTAEPVRPDSPGGAKRLLPRWFLLALIAAAFFLVPAAQASAFDFEVEFGGTGSGTIEGFGFFEPGEVF